jgi:hypothetical protein
LLRASRVFSIPSPLPQPQGELSSGAVFNSDSATLPHPTHLTITTPQAALKRGDWGFKRPLPLRSTTRTSTPFIRVKAIDTFEHITEFGSSADHTLSLQKWHEMGIPLSTPAKQTNSNFGIEEQSSGKSVFEASIDRIAPTEGQVLGKDDVRWKFSGPWLAGLTEGDFNAYVLKEVRKRKVEFRNFLRAAYAAETTQSQQRRATEEGEDIEAIRPAVQASDITDEQLTDYIKALRRDRTKLNQHVRSFLDLPPSPNFKFSEESLLSPISAIFESVQGEVQATSDSPYAESGPPKTHPSAGLSYSRTASHTFNHPLYGPQKYPPPVQARVVMPKGAATGNFAPVLGVGGFAVDVPASDLSFQSNPRNDRNTAPQIPGLARVDPAAVGGSKAWVHPKHARIDPKGRVILKVVKADPEAIAVKEGRVGDIPTKLSKRMTRPPRYGNSSSGTSSYGGGYGVGRQDFLGKAEDKGIGKADFDAVKELTSFVDRHGKGNVD